MWYVIQTISGKEEIVKTMIEAMPDRRCFDECIVVYYECQRKYQGRWHTEKRKMFPGYIFIVSDKPAELKSALRAVPELTKLLGYGETIVPISKEEEAFIRRLTGGDETVEMSFGVKEGDLVTITEGPLKGLESLIRKIDRHKRRAYLEMDMLGEVRTVEVGLEVVGKK